MDCGQYPFGRCGILRQGEFFPVLIQIFFSIYPVGIHEFVQEIAKKQRGHACMQGLFVFKFYMGATKQ